MNVFVQRALNRFGELDEADAVAFAEMIVEDSRRVLDTRDMSVPCRRELNLALAFLNLKFPFQCCGARPPEPTCPDCPMQPWDEKRQRDRPEEP